MKKSAIQHYLAPLMNDLTFVLVTGENLALRIMLPLCVCVQAKHSPAHIGKQLPLKQSAAQTAGCVATRRRLIEPSSAVDDCDEQRLLGKNRGRVTLWKESRHESEEDCVMGG